MVTRDYAKSREEADAAALAALAESLRVHVTSEFERRVKEVIKFLPGDVQKGYCVDYVRSSTHTFAEADLIRCEIKERYHSRRQGTLYALAVMDRVVFTDCLVRKAVQGEAKAGVILRKAKETEAAGDHAPALTWYLAALRALVQVERQLSQAQAVSPGTKVAGGVAHQLAEATVGADGIGNRVVITLVSGDGQHARFRQPLGEALKIRLQLNAGGKALPGLPVFFHCTRGRDSLVGAEATTDADGSASCRVANVLNDGIHIHSVEAKVDFDRLLEGWRRSTPLAHPFRYYVPTRQSTRVVMSISESLNGRKLSPPAVPASVAQEVGRAGFQVAQPGTRGVSASDDLMYVEVQGRIEAKCQQGRLAGKLMFRCDVDADLRVVDVQANTAIGTLKIPRQGGWGPSKEQAVSSVLTRLSKDVGGEVVRILSTYLDSPDGQALVPRQDGRRERDRSAVASLFRFLGRFWGVVAKRRQTS